LIDSQVSSISDIIINECKLTNNKSCG